MKAEVAFMNGGQTDGYYYIRIKGTDLIVCNDGHPDFLFRVHEGTPNAERKARARCEQVNKELEVL